MKRCAYGAIFTLMILLSACGENAAETADKAAGFYSSLSEFCATAHISMNHGEYVTEYVILHELSGEGHCLTVKEPLSLSGLSMTFDGEKTELRFKDALFLPPSLDGTKATPMKLLPDVLYSLTKGNYEAAYHLEKDGVPCISFVTWSKVDGEEFMYRVTLSAEGFEPMYAEVFSNGKAVLTAEYTDVQLVSG
ncbi:MAG: hypothetical protein IKM29_00075 [Clostridia bacterium]|nr:hypothetical protein [Clostridia bacterium]